jgi:hypothetical protein
MTEREWDELQKTLVGEYDEDLAHQAILELLEAEAKGTPIVNPLHWCRKCAARRKINRTKRNRFDLTEDTHKLVERSGLPALQVPASQLYLLMAGEGLGDDRPKCRRLSMTSAAVRKRRSRRRRRSTGKAA